MMSLDVALDSEVSWETGNGNIGFFFSYMIFLYDFLIVILFFYFFSLQTQDIVDRCWF